MRLLLNNQIPPNINLNKSYLFLKSFQKKEPEITIAILCKNEERCIQRCLTSIYNEISDNDEVIVLDTGSTDNTLKLLSNFPSIRLLNCNWENDFSLIRNIGLTEAKKDWIFFIDADEELKSQSLTNLKQALNIIDWLKLDSTVVAPTIINHNSTIAEGVRRIIKKDSNIKYYGTVHEELRKDISLLGKDVHYISLNNVILFHDGYQEKIIIQKNKAAIYYKGLQHMVAIEPMHPRWLYFLCRDNKSKFTSCEYEKALLKVIDLCGVDDTFKYYKIRSLSALISFYLDQHNLNLASRFLKLLRNLAPELSDVLYYDSLISYINSKQTIAKHLNILIQYRQSHYNDCGSLDSRLYHIDYLIALFLFEIDQYKPAFTMYNQLQISSGTDYLKKYKPLYEILNSFFS